MLYYINEDPVSDSVGIMRNWSVTEETGNQAFYYKVNENIDDHLVSYSKAVQDEVKRIDAKGLECKKFGRKVGIVTMF